MADALMLMVWNRSCKEVARIPLRSGVIRLLLFCESMVREAHCTSAYAASPSPQAMAAPPLKLNSSDTEYSVTNTGITPICHTNNSRAIRIQPLLRYEVTMACTSHVTAYIAHNVTILVFALNTNMIATATAAIRTLNTEQSRWREKPCTPATVRQRIATTLSAVTVINHSGEVTQAP